MGLACPVVTVELVIFAALHDSGDKTHNYGVFSAPQMLLENVGSSWGSKIVPHATVYRKVICRFSRIVAHLQFFL